MEAGSTWVRVKAFVPWVWLGALLRGERPVVSAAEGGQQRSKREAQRVCDY